MTPIESNEFPTLPAIVLAGGRSQRMGRPKALLPWPPSGLSFVKHVTNLLRDAGAAPLAVVTGAHHDAIAAALPEDVSVLFNAAHASGQLSSLQMALSWGFSHESAEWVLVTLVDLPALSPATVTALIGAARHTAALAVRPVVGDGHGHPVLWRRGAWPLITTADPAVGARAVMRSLAARGQVCDVPVEDPGVLRDVDTPADYVALGGAPE